MVFTQHAIERFRERYAGGLSHSHAKRELVVLSETARRLRQHTQHGQEQWEASDGTGMIFVVKRDRGGREPVCVTILFPSEEHSESADPEGGA